MFTKMRNTLWYLLLLGVLATCPNLGLAQLDAISDSLCSQTDTGCFFKPASCSSDIPSCDAVVAWTMPDPSSSALEIRINGKASYEWIALGLSESGKMDQTSVMACLNVAGVVSAKHYYNTGYRPSPVTDDTLGISDVQSSFDSSTGIRCLFNRTITVAGDNKIFPLSSPYSLLLGGGPVSTSSISYHSGDNPIVSSEKVTLTSSFVTTEGSGASNTLKKVHGCLMVSAWVISAAFGIVTARYMKPSWPGKKLCGKAPWFPIHQTCMILTLLCNLAGFIVIFIDIEGWSELPGAPNYQKAHPILGCVITALVIINPLMAVFRPAPDADNRPMFNWAHWFVGMSASILAVVNVYFGLTLPASEAFTKTSVKYMMIAFIAVYILAQLLLEINKCCGERRDRKKTDELEMSPVAGTDSKSEEKCCCVVIFRHVIWHIFLSAATGLGIAMVVNIAVN